MPSDGTTWPSAPHGAAQGCPHHLRRVQLKDDKGVWCAGGRGRVVTLHAVLCRWKIRLGLSGGGQLTIRVRVRVNVRYCVLGENALPSCSESAAL